MEFRKRSAGTYRDEDAKTLEAMARDGRLSLEEQKHLASVYAFSRTAQLRLENHEASNDLLPFFIRRTINSCHLPSFMKDIYKRDLMSNNLFNSFLVEQISPWDLLDLDNPFLRLVKTRREEKRNDKRKTYRPLPRSKVLKAEKIEPPKFIFETANERKAPDYQGYFIANFPSYGVNLQDHSVDFSEDMQIYGVPPNNGCHFYINYSIYGYEQPWDMLDLLLDNLGDEPEVRSILGDDLTCFSVSLQQGDRGRLKEQIKNILLNKKPEQVSEINRLFENQHYGEWLESDLAKYCADEDVLRPLLLHYRGLISQNMYRVRELDGLTSRLLFLSPKLGKIEWNAKGAVMVGNLTKAKQARIKEKPEELAKELLNFQHHYYSAGDAHVSVLIPTKTTSWTLIDWVKAVQREKETGTPANDRYISSWS